MSPRAPGPGHKPGPAPPEPGAVPDLPCNTRIRPPTQRECPLPVLELRKSPSETVHIHQRVAPTGPEGGPGWNKPPNEKRIALLTIIIGLLVGAVLYTTGTYLQNQKEDPIPGTASTLPKLTEYADFNCPHCADFALIAMPEIRREFIDPGLIEYEYAHFPFLANSSIIAAEASECARGPRQLQALPRRALPDSRRQAGTPERSRYDGCGRSNGARTGPIHRLLRRKRPQEGRWSGDTANARKAGVRGTPTLLLNGAKIRWRDYEDLRAQLLKATAGN